MKTKKNVRSVSEKTGRFLIDNGAEMCALCTGGAPNSTKTIARLCIRGDGEFMRMLPNRCDVEIGIGDDDDDYIRDSGDDGDGGAIRRDSPKTSDYV